MTSKSVTTLKTWRGPLGIGARHLLLALGLLVIAGGLWAAWQLYHGGSEAQARVPGIPLSQEIEDKFGVRFTFLAVIADGGMVDLRFRIIDPAKAANFGHYTETSPRLIAEDTGLAVDTTIMGLHHHEMEVGRVYYILYRNTANAIKPGELVTIAIDDMQIEHAVSW
jgi:hypothetical protein